MCYRSVVLKSAGKSRAPGIAGRSTIRSLQA
jgi:hypothetical protein